MLRIDLNSKCRRLTQTGLTYLAILFTIAIMGAGLALTGIVWHSAQQREKETELLFVGEAFRHAIASYYLQSPGAKRFPAQIDDLVKDPRFPGVKRHIRRIYNDPISAKPEWALVRGSDGGIIGIRSLSEQAPIRRYFPDDPYKSFSAKNRYADWVFIYLPGMPL